ncbi:GNAT family N-acetyltransferase [Streptomyces sp. NPDC058953]|uniref:GNAT family N-acetyltransferase n=1 Tax=Streptomyces sp. NPDC058953 TaxID=3346676 RepID=UPI00368B3627
MPITPDAVSAAGQDAPAVPAEPLSVLHTFQLTPAELAAVRALLDEAFEGDFSDEDFEHGLGGMHALIHDPAGRLIAHGSVIMRRVLHGGRWFRVGYVEALGVRADRQRQGLGGRLMAALEPIVARAYDFGALSASAGGPVHYRSRGWRPWEGRIEGVGPEGIVRLADEEGSTFVWGGIPAPEDALAFDWRDGDVL